MNMSGEERIAADRDAVWRGLNDADILKRCIPGCQSLELISPTELAAVVKIKIGPVSASFNGTVVLSNLNPPRELHHIRRGQGRNSRLCQGRRRRHATGRGRGNRAALRRQGGDRRQACPARLAPRRFDGAQARPAILRGFQPGRQRRGRGGELRSRNAFSSDLSLAAQAGSLASPVSPPGRAAFLPRDAISAPRWPRCAPDADIFPG